MSRSNGLHWTGKCEAQEPRTEKIGKCLTNTGSQVNRKATRTDEASLRCDSKEVKLSKFGYVQAWCHDYSTSKHPCLQHQEQAQQEQQPSAAALAALTTLPATPPSYVQPLMPTMGGLLQSTNGEFEPVDGRKTPL